MLLGGDIAWGQSLLIEDFNATTPPYTLTARGWSAHSSGGTNPIQATSPNLTYAGLITAGGSATLTTSGEDINKPLSTTVNSGSVYASFLLSVSSAQSAGDYFIHFGENNIGSNIFNTRVYIRSTSGGFQIGLGKGNETPNYSSTVYSLNTVYFIVIKHTLVTGAANDVSSLFVQPALDQAEPAVTITQSSTATDVSNINRIALRQGANSSAASVRVDYIRAGTTWESVTSSSRAIITATPISLTGASGLAYTEGSGPANQTLSVSGSSLTVDSGTITASSSSTAFTVTSTSAAFSGSALSPNSFTVSLVAGLPISSTYSTTLTFEGGEPQPQCQ